MQILRDLFETDSILARQIDVEQLQMNCLALRFGLEGFQENFFGLCITAEGQEGIGLDHRIHRLLARRHTHRGGAELAGLLLARGRRYAGAGRAEHRMRRKIGFQNRGSVLHTCRTLLAVGGNSQPSKQERQQRAAAKHQGRVFFHEIRFGRRRRGNRFLGRRRRRGGRGRFRSFRRWRGGIGRFRSIGRFHGFGWFGGFRCLRRLGGLGGFNWLGRFGGLRCGRRSSLLQIGTGLALDGCKFLQVAKILFQFRDATAGLLEGPFTRHEVLFECRYPALQGFAFGIPCRLRARDFQLVLAGCHGRLVFNFGRNLAADRLLRGLLPGGICSRRSRCEALSIGIEIGCLGDDFPARFTRIHRSRRFGIGDGKNLAGLEAVHVAGVKGVPVATEQCD